MPTRAPRPCTYAGCGRLTTSGRCDQHPLPVHTWGNDRGTRHDQGYGTEWDKLRRRILQRDNYLCQPCLRAGRLTALTTGDPRHTRAGSVDHIKRKADGGTDDPANLQAICRLCHEAKTAREGGGKSLVR